MDSGAVPLPVAVAISATAIGIFIGACARRKTPGISPGDALLVVKKGRIRKTDATFAALAGGSVRSLRGAAFPEAVFAPESVATAQDSQRRASEAPYRAVLKDGRTHVLVLPRTRGSRRMLIVRDITAARETEAALRTAETRHRDLFDGMLEAIVIHRDGVILDVNAAFTALTGYDRHEVLGKDGLALTFPTDAGPEVRRRILERDFSPYESRIRTRDGAELRVMISPREIARDGVVYRAATIRDITSLKQAEAGLAHRVSLHRATLEASLEGILVVDLTRRVDSFNRRFLEMWGLESEDSGPDADMIGKILDKITDREAFRRRVNELYSHPGASSDDLIELTDGRLFERHSRPQMLDGAPVGRVWTFRDVTEREHSRRAMRRQLALLDAMLEASLEGILVVDRAGRAESYNRRLLEIWRFEDDTFADMATRLELASGLTTAPEAFVARIREIYAGPDTPSDDIIAMKDGRTLERHSQPYLVDGRAVGRVWTYRDVTVRANEAATLRHSADELERLVNERTGELAKANETLRSSNAELEAFSFSVSHDLRAPLRAIDTLTQALTEDCGGSLGATGADYLARIGTGVRRMSRIMDDLIHLSRANRIEMKRENIDLAALAQSVDATLRREFPERSVVFDRPAEAFAFADKRLVRVVLENLIGNAWKYSSKKPTSVILFGFEDKPGGLREFFVRDNGAGFDPAFRHKLFKTFSRLHTPQDFEGTGLGLAIVARIVARHGGTISADSKPGEGAVFTFTLPAAEPTPTQP